jgi:hypothetical protein
VPLDELASGNAQPTSPCGITQHVREHFADEAIRMKQNAACKDRCNIIHGCSTILTVISPNIPIH